MVAVARAAKPGQFVIVHFGSGRFLHTDWLGALAVRELMEGRSEAQVLDRVEEIEAGTRERAQTLIERLAMTGAMTAQPPLQSSRRWRLRRLAARLIGLALGVLAPIVRVIPDPILAWSFGILYSSPLVDHVWRSQRFAVLTNLRAGGYADRTQKWMFNVGRGSASFGPLTALFMYLGDAVLPGRLSQVVDRLFDQSTVHDLAARLRAAGPTVAVFLHGGLCAAVPNVLRARGHEVVRAVVGPTHGVNVSAGSGPIGSFFGDGPELTVDVSDPLAAAALVRHLKSGKNVYIGLDKLMFERKPAQVEMLGLRFPRNDGPAWLSVRSGCPVVLWTTHRSASGFVITASPAVYPDPSLPVDEQVAALSNRLYRYAEGAIRDHPEAWQAWSYLAAFMEVTPGNASQQALVASEGC
jgi:lauroyl/myristoyl acyltransferase